MLGPLIHGLQDAGGGRFRAGGSGYYVPRGPFQDGPGLLDPPVYWGGGSTNPRRPPHPERGRTVAEHRRDPDEEPEEGPECGKIPQCPVLEPDVTVGDHWCLDCYTRGDPEVHGGLDCYRSYGLCTMAGQQCSYDENGLLVTADHPTLGQYAGTIDVVGVADGEHGQTRKSHSVHGVYTEYSDPEVGCCTVWVPDVVGHYFSDVLDSEDCPEYDAVQDCMRNGDYLVLTEDMWIEDGNGIPSGDQSGPRGGVTESEFEQAYDQCMKKHGCR